MRSQVPGAFQAVNYGTRPLGALAGGLLGTLIGPRATLWVAAFGGLTGFLLLLPTPVRSFRLPEPASDQPARGAQDLTAAADACGDLVSLCGRGLLGQCLAGAP